MKKCLRLGPFLILAAFFCAQPLRGQGGQSASSAAADPGLFGSVVVSVKTLSGIAPDTLIEVSLYGQQGQLQGSQTVAAGSVRLEQIPVGHYVVKASVIDYEDARESVELGGRFPQVNVFLELRPSRDPNAKPVAPGPPLLAPAVQKELRAGLDALRAGKIEEAERQLKS